MCLVPGGVCLSALWDTTPPPCEQNDKQVQKYYLGHNFVAAGNNFTRMYVGTTTTYACLFMYLTIQALPALSSVDDSFYMTWKI